MPLTIPDELLAQAHLTEQEARVEIACRLFEAGKLSLPMAGRFANLGRTEIEEELFKRHIPAYSYTEEDLAMDVASLQKMGVPLGDRRQ
jgi:predicted HTH domain antitoxin